MRKPSRFPSSTVIAHRLPTCPLTFAPSCYVAAHSSRWDVDPRVPPRSRDRPRDHAEFLLKAQQADAGAGPSSQRRAAGGSRSPNSTLRSAMETLRDVKAGLEQTWQASAAAAAAAAGGRGQLPLQDNAGHYGRFNGGAGPLTDAAAPAWSDRGPSGGWSQQRPAAEPYGGFPEHHPQQQWQTPSAVAAGPGAPKFFPPAPYSSGVPQQWGVSSAFPYGTRTGGEASPATPASTFFGGAAATASSAAGAYRGAPPPRG